MQTEKRIIYDLLVNSFNKIVTIEKYAWKKGPIKDLTINELNVIEAIADSKNPTMTETARQLNITVGTLTTAVNRLVRKEYVERIYEASDRRKVQLGLTKKGKLAQRLHEHFHYVMIKAMLEGTKQEDYQEVVESLQKLEKIICDAYKK